MAVTKEQLLASSVLFPEIDLEFLEFVVAAPQVVENQRLHCENFAAFFARHRCMDLAIAVHDPGYVDIYQENYEIAWEIAQNLKKLLLDV